MTYDFASARLTRLRLARGWTRAEAAHRLGVKTRRWQSWELGDAGPRPHDLAALGRLFDVHPSTLSSVNPRHASLAHLRAWAGWTNRSLSAHMGVSPTTITNIERYGRWPATWGKPQLARYSRALQVTVDEILLRIS